MSSTGLIQRGPAADDSTLIKAFISYARRDISRVDLIVRGLRDRGIECWVDRRKIRSGEAWQRELVDALNSCSSVIVFLSQNSARSDSWVHNELAYAMGLGRKRIIPVRMCSPDIQLGEIDLSVARLQQIFADGRRPEAVAEEIAAALGIARAVPFPRMSWLTRLLFIGSRRLQSELRRLGSEDGLQTNAIVPYDDPLVLYPQYSESVLDNEQRPCTIIVGQVGAGKSIFITELVGRQRQAFSFVFSFSADESERMFSSESSFVTNVWGAITIKMLERRRSYGLSSSVKQFPGKDFIALLAKSKVLFIFEDLHLLPFDFSAITRGLLIFFRECRIPVKNLYLVASSRREPTTSDPWLARHSRTISLAPLADITEISGAGDKHGMAAQEVLWVLCQKAGHDLARLTDHRELFARALPSSNLRTPLFLALTALVSSPSGENLALDRALRLRAAELIEFYLQVLVDRAPSIDFTKLVSDAESSEGVDQFKHFLLILSLAGVRARRIADVALSLARTRGLDQFEVEKAIDGLVVSGILVKNKFKGDIRFPHDSIEEYLLSWGFVNAKVDDREAWRRRCRSRDESLAEMLLVLLRTAEDWQLLAYESLPLATAVLLAERRDRRSGQRSAWALGLDESKLGNFLARWASDGAPFDVDADAWRGLDDAMQSLGITRWRTVFLDTIREIGPSTQGARAVLETQAGRSSNLLTEWAKTGVGRGAIVGALAWDRSRSGFQQSVLGETYSPAAMADLIQCWWRAREANSGSPEFQAEIEVFIRKIVVTFTEAELKTVFDALSAEQACFIARLNASAAYDVRCRIARSYARAGNRSQRSSLLLCPGKYQVQRSKTVTIADPVIIPVGYESVAQSNRELDARNALVDSVVGRYELMTWDEVLAASEVGSSGLMLIPDPNLAVEVFSDTSFSNQINFVRHGSTSNRNMPSHGGAVVVATSATGRGGTDGYDFFEGRLTMVYARNVFRPKSAIRPARKSA